MFGGEASEKRVKVLRGGERSRLAMIRLLLEPVNLLILDEPTNHLDMASKDILKEAILAFDGTAIIVSHDREFLDGLVSKVYEFGGGKVREHLGGIYDFLQHHQIESLAELGSADRQAKTAVLSGQHRQQNDNKEKDKENAAESKMSYEEHKEMQRRRSRLEKAIQQTERQIEESEQRLSELDALLMDAENAANMALVNEYTEVKAKVDRLVADWERQSEELESIN